MFDRVLNTPMRKSIELFLRDEDICSSVFSLNFEKLFALRQEYFR